MKYNQPYGITDPEAAYINGDPSVGRQGSIIPGEAVEFPQRELVAVIEAANQVSDNASLTQLLFAVRSQRMNYALAVDGGNPNTIAVEFDPPISNTQTPGMPLRVKALVNNTGHTLLSVDGAEHALRHADGSELAADEVKAGVMFEAVWNDSGYWEFNPYSSGAGGGGPGTNTFINIPFAVDTGTPNALIASFVPSITALVAGTTVEVRVVNDITGPSTIKVNALAPVPIVRGNGQPLQAGDAVHDQIMLLIYSAAAGSFQFSGLIPKAVGLGPVGSIILSPGSTAIPGTLKLNGATLLRLEHPGLWAYANASGRIVDEGIWTNSANHSWTAFSRGDGTTTFRVPDFRGEFMRFFDDARGIDASRVLGTQQSDIVGTLAMSGIVDLINPKASFGPMNMGSSQVGGAPPVLPPNYANAYVQNAELTFTNPRYEAYNVQGGGWPDVSPGTVRARDVGYNNWLAVTGTQPDQVSYGYVEIGWVAPYQDLKPPVSIWPSAWPTGWVHRENRITSAINLSGSGGGPETRPRNCALMPCIVDG